MNENEERKFNQARQEEYMDILDEERMRRDKWEERDAKYFEDLKTKGGRRKFHLDPYHKHPPWSRYSRGEYWPGENRHPYWASQARARSR